MEKVKVILIYNAPHDHVSGGQYQPIDLDAVQIVDAFQYEPGYHYRGASGARFLSEREADCFLMTTLKL